MGELPNESFPSEGGTPRDPAQERLASEVERLRLELEAREALLRRELALRATTTIARVEQLRVQGHQEAQRRRRDPLTGLLLHGTFRARVDFELTRAAALAAPIACLLTDLTGLGAVNAERGYAEGDRILGRVGHGLASLALARATRRPAILGRESGRSLAFVLMGADEAQVQDLAEGVLDLLEGLPGRALIAARVGTTWHARVPDAARAAWLIDAARAAIAGGAR